MMVGRANLESTWSQTTSGSAMLLSVLLLWLGATIFLRKARYMRSRTFRVMLGLNLAVIAFTIWTISR